LSERARYVVRPTTWHACMHALPLICVCVREIQPSSLSTSTPHGFGAQPTHTWGTKKKLKSEKRRGCRRYLFSGQFLMLITRGSFLFPISFIFLFIPFSHFFSEISLY